MRRDDLWALEMGPGEAGVEIPIFSKFAMR